MDDKSINITVNGQHENCPNGWSIHDYLENQGVNPAEVVSEYNGGILKPEHFSGQKLQDGDNIEFIRFVGGG